MTVPRFDLGSYSREITCADDLAKSWFDQGLLWLYGFNMEMAAQCFDAAATADPACAMAYWGKALAKGPFYNLPWEFMSQDELANCISACHAALAKARACSDVTTLERDLIMALSARFPQADTRKDRNYRSWDTAYADAMRGVYQRHSDDPDVASAFALALMTKTPWALWNLETGKVPENADTREAIAVLEAALAARDAVGAPPHPGLVHLHIHAWEMSPTPERALQTARTLRDCSPDCGHFHHMPAHIYVQCGLYQEALDASWNAAEADTRLFNACDHITFYRMDQCHHLHLLVYTGMMMGRFDDALRAADAVRAILTPEQLGRGNTLIKRVVEGYYAMRMHVLVRFGKWQQILEEPAPPDPAIYAVSQVFWRYARAIASATLGRSQAARAEQSRYHEEVQAVPPGRRLFNNPVADVFGVAEAMLEGELAYHEGRHDSAFARLRLAVARSEALIYNEPWAWMHPPRHALAALLSEQGRHAEALPEYEADLGLAPTVKRVSQHPDNVWALHGYHECLRRLDRQAEAEEIAPRLGAALAASDSPITSSCMCRKSIAEDPASSISPSGKSRLRN